MAARTVDELAAAAPDLLDWSGADVYVIKDPKRPLSVVSDLGVVHAGMEPDSAVFRVTGRTESFILKQHSDPLSYRREVANMTFVNARGLLAPQIVRTCDRTGMILMEDLGDYSLAYVWHQGRMDEYATWVRRAVPIVAELQEHAIRDEATLWQLHGGRVLGPLSGRPLPGGLARTLDEVLQLSRRTVLADEDRDYLAQTEQALRTEMDAFNRVHRGFRVPLVVQQIMEKDGQIRVVDWTHPPIGGLVGQFNVAWHLPDRHDILEFYLSERRRRRLPPVDRDRFLWLEAGLQLLECVEWIRIYCREAIEGEHVFTQLDGSPITDYAAGEHGNLEAIRRALEPHDDWQRLLRLLSKHFDIPPVGHDESA